MNVLRSILRTVVAVVRGFAAWIVLLVPGILFLLWCGVYLLECADVAMAPGEAIEYSYDSESGPILLRAGSYRVVVGNFSQGGVDVHLTQLSLQPKNGSKILTLKSLKLSFADGLVRGLAQHGQGAITRSSDGKFDVARFLPRSSGPPSQTRFVVKVRDFAVTYRDGALREALTWTEVDAEGVGPSVVLTGRANWSGVGATSLQALVKQDGGNLHIQVPQGQFQRLLAHVDRWEPSTPTLGATNLTGALRASAVWGKLNRVRVDGTVDLKFSGLRVGEVARSASGKAAGTFTQDGFTGQVRAADSGLSVDARGTTRWVGPAQSVADVEIHAASERSLPALIRNELKGANFSIAAFRGRVGWTGSKLTALGNAQAEMLRASGQMCRQIRAQVALTQDGLDLRNLHTNYQGATVVGDATYRTKGSQLRAALQADHLDPSRWMKGASGRLAAKALVRGTLEKPEVLLDAAGPVTVRLGPAQSPLAGQVEVRGAIQNGRATISRALWTGKEGIGVLSGTINLARNSIDAKVQVGNVPLKKWLPDLGGLGFARGHLTGSLASPQYVGRADVYGATLGGQRIPAIRTVLRASPKSVLADSIQVDRGALSLHGALAWNPRSNALSGKLSGRNLDLTEATGGLLTGTFDVANGVFSGTAAKPLLTGNFTGSNTYLSGSELNQVAGSFTLNPERVELKSLSAKSGPGDLTMSAVYNFRQERYLVSGKMQGLSLATSLASVVPIPIEGTMSGGFSLAGKGRQLLSGKSALHLDDLAVSGYRVGSGEVSASNNGKQWIAKVELGQDDRFIVADALTYDPASEQIGGGLDFYNVDLGAIGRSILSQNYELTAQQVQFLQDVSGSLNAGVRIAGTTSNPEFQLRDVVAQKLMFQEAPAGTVTLNGAINKNSWRVESLRWQREDGILRASGKGDKHGITESAVALDGFRTEWAAPWVPSLTDKPGVLSFDLDLSGPWEELNGHGNASLQLANEGTEQNRPSINIFALELEKGQLLADAVFTGAGFTGTAHLGTTLAGLGLSEGQNREIKLDVNLAKRSLSDFAEYAPMLNPEKTKGTLGGSLQVRGIPEKLVVTGDLHLLGEQLGFQRWNTVAKAFEPLRTEFSTYDLHCIVADNKLKLDSGRIDLASGGHVTIDFAADLGQALGSDWDNLQDLLDAISVQGKVGLQQVKVSERMPVSKEPFGLLLDGELGVSGSVRSPVISTPSKGGLLLSNVELPTPDETEPREQKELIIDPIFQDFVVSIIGEAHIRATNTNLWLVGGGTVDGSLSYPNVNFATRLSRGLFELPNARIQVEPGSPIRLTYRATPFTEPFARLDVDLEGRTSVPVRRGTDSVERYDVELRIRGNLLEQSGVVLSARSDPPDLSEQELLAILGQRELIEQLASVAVNRPGQGKNQLQQGLLGLALPTLSNPLTQKLAQSFGLDYLALDYNAFDLASLSAGRTLAKGLTVTARRQITETVVGRPKYEFKLQYRIPVRTGNWQRTRLGVGFTESVPWRITLDYVIRR